MRIENVSRVLVLPFTITQKPQVPLQVQHFSLGLLFYIQDFMLKRIEYSIFKKRFSIFHFKIFLNFFVENFNISENDIIIVGTVKELWYEQYEPLCSYMQVSFILLYEILHYYKI
jgi:hypothetical protein